MHSPPTSGPPEERQERTEPLPDFSGVDVPSLRDAPGHPVLSAVVADLLDHWPAEGEAVAYYDDSPGSGG
ncbi:YxD-tail cyclophane-containing RiPP peptide [Streptomyces sp. NPDC058691]|uniref:YxD-tail cyclophane-containing RiPP peptide n=1 Tax=Streptomyces sp. NPDC058691 TaxID=3346601 RepID=UPI00364F5073